MIASFFRTLARMLVTDVEPKFGPRRPRAASADYRVAFEEPTAEKLAALDIPEGHVAVPYYVLGSLKPVGVSIVKAPHAGQDDRERQR